jgi:hypothetical protein
MKWRDVLKEFNLTVLCVSSEAGGKIEQVL